MASILDSVLSGARHDAIEGVEVVTRAALVCAEVDVLEADGYILGTPANIGYMSGALKHFFDRIYYPCLEETRGRPFGAYVHGNEDTTGAVRALESIAGALGWRKATETVTVASGPSGADLEACVELGGVVAASLVTDW